ncbi:MAG: hypothetical protein J2P17_21405 [Mycobacterium sp.]|nr:hypothetical protein [Mycobacterium sp.]
MSTRSRPGYLRHSPEETDRIKTARILAAIRHVDPDLPQQAILAIVVPISPWSKAQILGDLEAHPGVLTSGRADGRSATLRLIAALTKAGSRRIRRPSCKLCRRVRELPTPLLSGGRICASCARRLARRQCPGCGSWRTLSARLDGSKVCSTCARDQETTRHITARQESRIGVQSLEGPVGRRRRRGPDGACQRCARDTVVLRRVRGETLCSRCSNRPSHVCAECGRPRSLASDDICCPNCGSSDLKTCPTCGSTVLSAFGCHGCRLNRRLDRLIRSGDAARADQLRPFLDALRRADKPLSSIEWLGRRTPGRVIFDDLLQGRLDVSHESLDEAATLARPGSRRVTSVDYLRQMLVDTGVLPARDEHLHRLEQTIARLLDQAAAADGAVLRRYASWVVLPRVRRRINQGKSSRAVTDVGRVTMITVDRFLTWLRQAGISLDRLDQATVDHWFALHPHLDVRLPQFIRWARREHLTPRELNLPDHHKAPRLHEDEAAIYQAARRCLHDHQIAPPVRLAASLILLYGQSLSRIASLRIDDLDLSNPDNVTIRLAETPIHLLPPMADAARQTAALAAHKAPGITRAVHTNPVWLFPGLPPTRHTHPSALRQRIAELCPTKIRGIRNTALLTLARDVPPVVLADLLGLNVNTVQQWRDLAGGDYAAYVGTAGGQPRP